MKFNLAERGKPPPSGVKRKGGRKMKKRFEVISPSGTGSVYPAIFDDWAVAYNITSPPCQDLGMARLGGPIEAEVLILETDDLKYPLDILYKMIAVEAAGWENVYESRIESLWNYANLPK